MKNCDRGLENAARGRRPRAAFSRPRFCVQNFVLRTKNCFNFCKHKDKALFVHTVYEKAGYNLGQNKKEQLTPIPPQSNDTYFETKIVFTFKHENIYSTEKKYRPTNIGNEMFILLKIARTTASQRC